MTTFTVCSRFVEAAKTQHNLFYSALARFVDPNDPCALAVDEAGAILRDYYQVCEGNGHLGFWFTHLCESFGFHAYDVGEDTPSDIRELFVRVCSATVHKALVVDKEEDYEQFDPASLTILVIDRMQVVAQGLPDI